MACKSRVTHGDKHESLQSSECGNVDVPLLMWLLQWVGGSAWSSTAQGPQLR